MNNTETIFERMETLVNSDQNGNITLSAAECAHVLKYFSRIQDELNDLQHLNDRLSFDLAKEVETVDYSECGYNLFDYLEDLEKLDEECKHYE